MDWKKFDSSKLVFLYFFEGHLDSCERIIAPDERVPLDAVISGDSGYSSIVAVKVWIIAWMIPPSPLIQLGTIFRIIIVISIACAKLVTTMTCQAITCIAIVGTNIQSVVYVFQKLEFCVKCCFDDPVKVLHCDSQCVVPNLSQFVDVVQTKPEFITCKTWNYIADFLLYTRL